MFKITFKKKRKGIATITIVLLLGFLSLLSSTSIFTFNTWRWDNLETSIKKENYDNATSSGSLYGYILLARQRNMESKAYHIYDTYENRNNQAIISLVIPPITTLADCTGCNVASMPSEFNTKAIRVITSVTYSQDIMVNAISHQACCTAGIYKDSTEDEIQTEGIIHQYSKLRCKNLDWPNLQDSTSPLMSTTITP